MWEAPFWDLPGALGVSRSDSPFVVGFFLCPGLGLLAHVLQAAWEWHGDTSFTVSLCICLSTGERREVQDVIAGRDGTSTDKTVSLAWFLIQRGNSGSSLTFEFLNIYFETRFYKDLLHESSPAPVGGRHYNSSLSLMSPNPTLFLFQEVLWVDRQVSQTAEPCHEEVDRSILVLSFPIDCVYDFHLFFQLCIECGNVTHTRQCGIVKKKR